jgi:hypothetical protein
MLLTRDPPQEAPIMQTFGRNTKVPLRLIGRTNVQCRGHLPDKTLVHRIHG